MKEENAKKAMAMAFAMGAELVVSVLVGIGLGYYVGPYVGSSQWAMVIGCFAGFSLWVWRMVLAGKQMSK